MKYRVTNDCKAGDWHIESDDYFDIERLSEAEARVIAFALNAIADGDRLAKDWGANDIFDPTTIEYYAGPTLP